MRRILHLIFLVVFWGSIIQFLLEWPIDTMTCVRTGNGGIVCEIDRNAWQRYMIAYACLYAMATGYMLSPRLLSNSKIRCLPIRGEIVLHAASILSAIHIYSEVERGLSSVNELSLGAIGRLDFLLFIVGGSLAAFWIRAAYLMKWGSNVEVNGLRHALRAITFDRPEGDDDHV
jgi:hypothetical protein